MSEWKPGDVVSAYVPTRLRRCALIFLGGAGGDWPWRLLDGDDPREDGIGAHNVHDVRPLFPEVHRRLAVIDPEDREQVERLVTLLRAQSHAPETADIMQAALREFANPTPTKPEEPTGDGAVVRTAEGKRYVRLVDGWWRGDPHCSVNWAALGGDLTVLSEGVQP